jgi:hypothetical protein
MIANDALREKTKNLRTAQKEFLLERLVILDTSEEYLRILGVPEELLARLNPPEETAEEVEMKVELEDDVVVEVLDDRVVVEAEEVEVVVMDTDPEVEASETEEEAAAEEVYEPFELPEEFKEIDTQKKQELVELMLEHPEITELSELLKMLGNEVEENPQEVAETATKNALKKTYKGLYNLARGLGYSALDAAIVQELEADIRNWLTTYDKLTIARVKEDIENQADILEAALDTIPAILQQVEAFRTAYDKDDLDIATVSKDDLLEGLQRFKTNLTKRSIESCLKRLKAAKQTIETYAAAAGFLFDTSFEVVQKVNDFKLAKQIIATYPSNVIGTYYRGDKRAPVELNYGGKGFEAFQPLSLEEARAMAKAWFGAADTKSPVEYYKEYTEGYVSNYISVGNDIACMGYGCIGTQGADRNVYQIQIEGLKEVPATAAALGEAPHAEQGPILILNADKIEDATVIAVKGSERETIFFTGIDSGVQLIYKYPTINKTIEGGWVEGLKNG